MKVVAEGLAASVLDSEESDLGTQVGGSDRRRSGSLPLLWEDPHGGGGMRSPHRLGRRSRDRQNPISEALVEPSARGGLQRISSSACWHGRDAIEEFRFAHRCQIQLLRVAVRDPRRDWRVGSGHMSSDATFESKTSMGGCSGKFRRLAHRATRGKFEFDAAERREAFAGELR